MRPVLTLARNAMATRFEIVLHGEHAATLRAAGEEALDEIERLEARLSFFRPESEISRLNATASCEPVRVSTEVFRLLELCQAIHRETQGAFDITIAPLMRLWGFRGKTDGLPKAEELAAARACVGMHLVALDPARQTVYFARAG